MGPSSKTADFLKRFYELIDSDRFEEAMQMIAPDATLRFANHAPVTGRTSIALMLGVLRDSLDGMRHQLVTILDGDLPIVAYELIVTYRRRDGRQITIPAAVVCEIADGFFSDLRVYIDLAPVWAETSALPNERGRVGPIRDKD